MPSGTYITVGLEVNNRKLAEYKIKDKIYTEVDLHGPTSYTIEDEGQHYPVVPFAVLIQLVGLEPLWLKVHLDGQQICSRPLLNYWKCNAVKSGSELRELLFSIPRIVEDQETPCPLGKYAGSLNVAVFETRVIGEKRIPIYSEIRPRTSGRHGHVLHHLSKKDVQLSHKAAESGAVVTREGRTMMELEATGRFRHGKNFRCTDRILEEIVIHIRPIISNFVPVFEQNAKHVDKLREKEFVKVREPLGDVGNSLKLPNANFAATTHEMLNAKIAKQQEEIFNDGEPIPPGISGVESAENDSSSHYVDHQVTAANAELGEQAARDSPTFRPQTFTGLLPVDRMKTRLSCMFLPGGEGNALTDQAAQLDLIPAELIKKRQSFLIPSDLIKRRESTILLPKQKSAEYTEQGAVDDEEGTEENSLIRPERIKKRQSFLIPADLIKRRESCVMPMLLSADETWGSRRVPENMIPPEQIKRRLSTWIPPDNINIRESELGSFSPTSDESTYVKHASHSLGDPSKKMNINDESFIVIDESDDEDSIVYLYDEADNSVVCVGDDDCYMLDISQNLSLVELNSDDESMDEGTENELLGI